MTEPRRTRAKATGTGPTAHGQPPGTIQKNAALQFFARSAEDVAMRTFSSRASRNAASAARGGLPRGALFSSMRTKLLATVLLASAVSVAVGLTAIREIRLVSTKGES